MKGIVQFITHRTERYGCLDGAQLALEGGCKWIQLRMKNASHEERRAAALPLQKLCRQYGAALIIDDDVLLAKEIHADGVHLGKNDMPVAEARALLGKDYIIGGTANTFEDIDRHCRAGADYIGCGPFRFTTTKEKLSPVLGLEGYRNILRDMERYRIPLPLVAIGGILKEDLAELKATGIRNIAISGAVLNSPDPVEEMREIIKTLNSDIV